MDAKIHDAKITQMLSDSATGILYSISKDKSLALTNISSGYK